MRIKSINPTNLLILFLIIAAWLLTAVEIKPFLHYQNQQIGFNAGFSFLKEYLNYPGGISNYLAEFLSQFFYYNSFGSFIIVLVATLQGVIALKIINRLIGKTKFDLSIFAVVLLLGVIILSDYRYPYYVSVRLLLSFIFVWMFCIINEKYSRQSIYVWPVIALILFYIGSGPSMIVFAVSTAFIYILTQNKKVKFVVFILFLLFAGLVPFLGYKFVFPSNLSNLYRLSVNKPPDMLAYTIYYQLYAYYFILPIILLILFIKKIINDIFDKKALKNKADIEIRFYKKRAFLISLQFIVCLAFGYFLFIKSFDPFKKKLVYIEYYAEKGQWENILEVAETVKIYDLRINYHINRSYAHLGQLSEKMFNYPQLLGSKGLFFDASSKNGSFTMQISDLYFDLGLMSESQHWAYEAQTLLPNSPRILKRLIMINLVNRKYYLAEKFLNVLDRNILYRDWVKKHRRYVSNPSLSDRDKVISEKRRFAPKERSINSGPEENLKYLLATNKNNRLAYDYLITLYILDINLQGFVRYIRDHQYYNINTLPRSWAETLSFYLIKNKTVPTFVNSETVSDKCMQNLREFNRLMKQFKNKEDAQNTVRKDFEDSFWYYLVYLNPQVTNVLNTKVRF